MTPSLPLWRTIESGSYTLWIDGLRFHVAAANASNKILSKSVYGYTTGASTVYTNSTAITSSGTQTLSFTAYNCGAFYTIVVYLVCECATVNLLNIAHPELRCYYV